MTRANMLLLVLVFGGIAALTGYDGIAEALMLQSSSDVAINRARAVIEWLRVIGGLVGMLMGIVAIYVYYRVTVRQKTAEALQASVDILEKQISIRDRERIELLAAFTTRETELTLLRSRTDLNEVLKLQTELIGLTREHDKQVLEALTTLHQSGQTRYAEATLLLKSMLDSLVKRDAEAVDQTKKNNEAIAAILRVAESISERLGRVETTVDVIAEQISSSPPSGESERRRQRR